MKQDFFYKKTGNSQKTILLIHGWTHASSVWDKVLPTLSQKYTVITIDLLGHGRSKAPHQKENLLDFLSERLYHFIQEQNWKPEGIIAHSMGGVITMKMLEKYQMKLNKLMIIGSPFNGLPTWLATVGGMDKLVKASFEFKEKLPKKLNQHLTKLGSKFTIKDLSCLHQELLLDIGRANPYYVSKLFKELSTPNFKLKEKNKERFLVKSALITRGEYDILASREDLIKLARFLNGEYYQFPNVSHTVPIEAPQELSEMIFKLLD